MKNTTQRQKLTKIMKYYNKDIFVITKTNIIFYIYSILDKHTIDISYDVLKNSNKDFKNINKNQNLLEIKQILQTRICLIKMARKQYKILSKIRSKIDYFSDDKVINQIQNFCSTHYSLLAEICSFDLKRYNQYIKQLERQEKYYEMRNIKI